MVFGPRVSSTRVKALPHTAAYPQFHGLLGRYENVSSLIFQYRPLEMDHPALGRARSVSLGVAAPITVRHESMGVAYGGTDIKSSGTINEGRF